MLSLIAAVANNNCIGAEGHLPWHMPEDLKHFKQLTMGKPVLMGRKTWESLPEKFRPLPGRTNVVITRQSGFQVPSGAEVFNAIEEALSRHKNEEIMVIGGGQIYAETIGRADRLYITEVHREAVGDVFFPEINKNKWKEIEREEKDGFAFVTYARR